MKTTNQKLKTPILLPTFYIPTRNAPQCDAGGLPPKSGFTLVEILITMTLLAVTTLAVMLNSSSTREKQTLNTAALQTVSLLDEARNLSISNNQEQYYGVRFDNSTSPQTITLACYSAGCIFNNQVIKLPSQVTLNNLPPGQRVLFLSISGRAAQPINQPKTSDTTVVLKTTHWKTTIVVPPTGSIYHTTIQKI